MENVVTLKDILMENHNNIFEVNDAYVKRLFESASEEGDYRVKFVENLHAAQIERYGRIMMSEDMKHELTDIANTLFERIVAAYPGVSIDFRGRIKSLVSFERKVNMLIYTTEDRIEDRDIEIMDYSKNMERNLDCIGLRLTVAGLEEEKLVKCIYHVANRFFGYMLGWGFTPVIPTDMHDMVETVNYVSGLDTSAKGYYKDYLSTPKSNGYSSLHIVWFWAKYNVNVEIQFRTQKMHMVSEYGPAAHAEYKKSRYDTSDYESKYPEVKMALHRSRVLDELEKHDYNGVMLNGFMQYLDADNKIRISDTQGLAKPMSIYRNKYVGR